MKKYLLITIVAACLCGCNVSNLTQVKQEVQNMRDDVQTVEATYRSQGLLDDADRMLRYKVQLVKLSAILNTELPQNQCEAVQEGFRLTLEEMTANHEKPEYVIMALVFKRIVEGYVCAGVK